MKTQRNGQRIGEIGPGRIDYSVGKVKEFDGAVNDGEAEADEGINRSVY